MTPRSHRRSGAGWSVALALGTAALLSACSSPPVPPPAQPSTAVPSTEPSPAPSPSPSPTTAPVPPELAAFLDRIPAFDPAPQPTPVTLDRNDGESAFAHQLSTSQPVAFITIDDGALQHPYALDLIRAARVPVTLFLTTNMISSNPDYFRALQETGYVTIQNHTVSHPDLTGVSYEEARNQLCTASDRLENWFGHRPVYYRPPYGEISATVRQAAWDCGLQAGFHWRETADNGWVWYQRDEGHIHPGDIILMHFRPRFPEDFLAILNAIHASGLVPARLEDYVRVPGAQAPTPPPLPLAPLQARAALPSSSAAELRRLH